MASPGKISLIKALALKHNLDPQAVLAVAQAEGLGGGIGDSGTSFGPFQLHKGGALPAGIPLAAAQDWSWGRGGLEYALSRIASVASGLHGPEAVRNIVSRFERPADPAGEIQRALANYGNGQTPSAGVPAGIGSLGSAAVPAQSQGSSGGNSLMDALLRGETDLTGVIAQMHSSPLQGPTNLPNAMQGPTGGSGFHPAELLQEGTGGPTHSTGPHVHVAFNNPGEMLKAIDLAEKLGLHAGENPYYGNVDPVHAKNSYHYKTFKGTYRGHKLGQALDVSGKGMKKFYQLLGGV